MNLWIATAGVVCVCCGQLDLLADDASSSEAREIYQRAAAALLAKDISLATAELERLVDAHPSDELAPLAALRLAECHLSQNDAAAATKLVDDWLPKLMESPRTMTLDPSAVLRAHYVTARADFLAERFGAVIKLAREQADIHARRSSLTSAEKTLLEQFRELAEQAKKRREQNLGVQLRAAAEQVRNKNYPEAMCTLEQCDLRSLSHAWRWRYHVLHSQCVLGQGDAQAALKELDQIVYSELTEQEQIAVRVACLDTAMTGQLFDRAQAEIDGLAPAAEKDEQLGAATALRAVEVAMFRKDREKARQIAKVAKERYPKFAALYEFDLLLARNALAQIQFAEARQILQSIIESPPPSDRTAAPRAQWLLGESFFSIARLCQGHSGLHRRHRRRQRSDVDRDGPDAAREVL